MEALPPIRKVNVFLKNRKSKYLKIMEIYYKVLHIACFLDFGFFEFKSYSQRIIWNTITIVQMTTFCCVSSLVIDFKNTFDWSGDVFTVIYYWAMLIYYVFNVLFLTFMKRDRTLCKVFLNLRTIDAMLRVDSSSYNIEFKILIINFLHIFFKIMFSVGSNAYFHEMTYFDFVNAWSCSCLQIVLISYAFAFYSINLRLKQLLSTVEASTSNFYSLQLIYKAVVELTEELKSSFDALFVAALLFYVPQVMSNIYNMLDFYFHDDIFDFLPGFLPLNVLIGESLMILFAPAICASMLSTQVDKLVTVLHDKLLKTRDVVRVREIERFIEYVEARGFRFQVYKTIPLDAELPGMVLSFCVTYLIVIIQFTIKDDRRHHHNHHEHHHHHQKNKS